MGDLTAAQPPLQTATRTHYGEIPLVDTCRPIGADQKAAAMAMMAMAAGDPGDGAAGIKAAAAAAAGNGAETTVTMIGSLGATSSSISCEQVHRRLTIGAGGEVDTTEQTEGESGTATGTSTGGMSIGTGIIIIMIRQAGTVNSRDAMAGIGTMTDHRMGTGAIGMGMQILAGTPEMAESQVATAGAVRTRTSELARNPR